MEEEVIPVLYVEEAGRSVDWYGRLGFQKEWEHQFEPGFPWFVSVARGRARLYLSEHKGDARPNTLIHLNVRDIDAGPGSSACRWTRKVLPGGSANWKTSTATGFEWRLRAPNARVERL